MIYGNLPEDLGLIDLSPREMMFWMYLPIRTPKDGFKIPDQVRHFDPIVEAAVDHETIRRGQRWELGNLYVYLTAKTLWVTKDNIGNRPGWHSDGFGGDDINYIWADRAPTEFLHDAFELPDNCADAMERMTARANKISAVRNPKTSEMFKSGLVIYPDKHLLRLDPSVIHRSPVEYAEGMRTFVKVSFSTERYNLEGNSINHEMTERWPLVPREIVRNHPVRTDYVLDQTASS